MSTLKKLISISIEIAKTLGLNDVDLNYAKDFLTHGEYGLAFDTVITQFTNTKLLLMKRFMAF